MASNKQVLDELRAQGYQVEVCHNRAWGCGMPPATGGLTQVSIMTATAEVAYGEARCNNKDHYVKKIGLAIALGRAVKQLKEKSPCPRPETI